MNENITLFIYGTLTFPEVVYALTGKRFKNEEAELQGYSVRKIDKNPTLD